MVASPTRATWPAPILMGNAARPIAGLAATPVKMTTKTVMTKGRVDLLVHQQLQRVLCVRQN